jgi:MOSC domain-containing protein YiiM
LEVVSDLPWTDRRANLLIEGLQLEETTGRLLRVGDLLLEVTGETKPCDRMEEAAPGLRGALSSDWRGGVTCRVVEGGSISVGDIVGWEAPSPD